MTRVVPSSLLLLLLAAALPAVAADFSDPFSTEGMVTSSPADSGNCSDATAGRPLTLADIIGISLCNNPQTRASWASARSAAARVGVSQSSWLPTLSLQGSGSHSKATDGPITTVSDRQNASLSLSYLLYDFGGREASIDSARELLAAANASSDSTLQTIFLSAAQAYFSLMSARASMEASRANETTARESLEAAETRVRAGAATPADRLQAKTALSQAKLDTIRAEGTMQSALGTLANIMGMQPNEELKFVEPPADARPDIKLEMDVQRLIGEAQKQRPDLAAAEARIRAAEASVEAARATGRPQLSLDATAASGRSSAAAGNSVNSQSSSIALNLNFPLFSGFNTAYQRRAAEADLEVSIANRQQLAQQVALQVWQAYQNLRTEGQALRTTEDLLASSRESEALNLGRYRAGVGNILDLLTAQSTLASARQQHVTALYNWHTARFSLAQAIGALDLNALQQIRQKEQ